MTIHSRLRAFVMDDALVIRSAFDQSYKAELAATIGNIDQPLFTLVMAGFQGEIGAGSARFHALALLKGAVETVISSLELIRQAATVDGLALLRIAVEAAAVAIWIAADDEAFSEYSRRDRNFKSPRAIACVREKLPELAEFWGALSQATVHPNIRVFGPRPSPTGGATIAFLRRELDPIRDHMALRALSVAAAILLRAAELALLIDDPEHPGWLRLPGSDFSVTATAASLLDRRYREFKSNG